jgi:hypothetical protein
MKTDGNRQMQKKGSNKMLMTVKAMLFYEMEQPKPKSQ